MVSGANSDLLVSTHEATEVIEIAQMFDIDMGNYSIIYSGSEVKHEVEKVEITEPSTDKLCSEDNSEERADNVHEEFILTQNYLKEQVSNEGVDKNNTDFFLFYSEEVR